MRAIPTIILAAAIITPPAVLSSTPDLSTKYIITTRSENNTEEFNKAMSDSIKAYEQKAIKARDELMLIKDLRLLSQDGKPVASRYQLDFLGNLISDLSKSSDENSLKIAAKARKSYDNGKVDKSLFPYLDNLLLSKDKDFVGLCEDFARIRKSPGDFLSTRHGGKFAPQIITFTDTLYNPDYRPVLFLGNPERLNRIDKEAATAEGWEWVDYNGMKSVSKTYPVEITYSIDENHPDVRFVHEYGYSEEGKLLYAPLVSVYDAASTAILKKAYNENAYNIKSRPQAVQHYIKVKLGLEDYTPAEKKANQKSQLALANVFLGSYRDAMSGVSSSKADQRSRARGQQFIKSLSNDGGFYNKEGSAWIKQIYSDNEGNYEYPYVIERLSPTSFASTYVSKEGKVLFRIISKAEGTKPYQASYKHAIEMPGDEAVFDPSEIKQIIESLDHNRGLKNTDKTIIYSVPSEAIEDNTIFERVDKPAEFPGGLSRFYEFVSKNLKYPEGAIEKGIQGRVMVQFVIEKDGSLTSPSIVKSVDRDLDREALRMVGMSPKWQPALLAGFPVRSKYSVPITFRLSN